MTDRCDIFKLDLNPPLIIIPYKVNDQVTVNVIDDGKIIGGSKLRALGKFVEEYSQYNEFVYAGPSNGFAQVALTIACVKAGKKATLFIQNTPGYNPRLTFWCQKAGAQVFIFYDKLEYIEAKAKQYTENKNDVYLIPFGLDSPEYNELLYEQLLEVIPANLEPKRLWITVGSGTLLRTLAKIWTHTEFFPVQVGKRMWQDQYEPNVWKRLGGQKRIDQLKAPQKFFEDVPPYLLPPYPSVANYDAKVWQQVVKYAQDGDYVWNVASTKSVYDCNIDLPDEFNLQTLTSRTNPDTYNIVSADYLPENIKSLTEDQQFLEYYEGAKELLPLIRNGTIWYPFQKYYVDEPEILFENLKKVKLDVKHENYRLYSYNPPNNFFMPSFLSKNKNTWLVGNHLFRGKPTTISGKGNYSGEDVIIDYFVEDIRLRTKRYDQEYSVLQCWEVDQCVLPVLAKALREDVITPYSLRMASYDEVQEAGTFGVTRAIALIKLVLGNNVKGKKWLDISSGWGDRLIAAMSLDMIYTGYDPNIDLIPGHSEMIRRFGDPNKHKVIYQPFEKADIKDGPYDVVMTSPPFFDVEEYSSGQEGQSIVSYPGFNTWVINFLFVALSKAWDNLKEGGYLILHLGDTKQLNVCEMTNIFIENYLVGASWEGIIGLSGGSKNAVARPVWCWLKMSRYSIVNRWQNTKLEEYPRTLYYYYPDIQKGLILYHANKYISISNNKENTDTIRQELISYYPSLFGEINDLFSDNILSQLISSIGNENTIKWCVAMIKLSLFTIENDVRTESTSKTLNTLDVLEQEYTRYTYVEKILDAVTINKLDAKKITGIVYEARNSTERWLLSMANFSTNYVDSIFSTDILDKNNRFNVQLKDELIAKLKVDEKSADKVIDDVIKLSSEYINFLKNPNYENDAQFTIVDGLFTYKSYSRQITPERMALLRTLGTDYEIARMLLRYASILPGSQHWNMPIETFKTYYDRGIRIEGFASPVNAQLIVIDRNCQFCSLFPDVDKPFGSIGNFFTTDFVGKSVSVGPPYTVELFEKISVKLENECIKAERNKSKVLFYVTFSAWEDTEGFQNLLNSKYTHYAAILPAKTHFYINSNGKVETPITSTFNTVFFDISVGHIPLDHSNLFNTMSTTPTIKLKVLKS